MNAKSGIAVLGLILTVTGGMFGAREFRRSRLRSEYLARAHQQQKADSLQRELRRRFPELALPLQLPPCRPRGEPEDHMPIASVRSELERMPVAARICNDTMPKPVK